MRLHTRLSKLEAASGLLRRCRVCGAEPGDSLLPVRFAERDEELGPQHCPGCGRMQWFSIDIGEMEGGEGWPASMAG